MEFSKFVRKPFAIEAVEVTDENIAEIAEMLGDLKHKPDGTPFVAVNWRRVPNVSKVYAGFWVTKMGDNVRCYSPKVFVNQFVETNDEIDAWVAYLNQETVVLGEAAYVEGVAQEESVTERA